MRQVGHLQQFFSKMTVTCQRKYSQLNRRNVLVHPKNLGQRITACPDKGGTRSQLHLMIATDYTARYTVLEPGLKGDCAP